VHLLYFDSAARTVARGLRDIEVGFVIDIFLKECKSQDQRVPKSWVHMHRGPETVTEKKACESMASGLFKAMPKCPHITEAVASLAIFLLCASRNTLLLRLTSHSYESSSVQTNLSTVDMQIVTKYDATIERFVKADRQAEAT
jgi:hypothetical protein